ncbi:MAG: hypothetical protein AAF562_06875 [Pseudomonadota bacterium]
MRHILIAVLVGAGLSAPAAAETNTFGLSQEEVGGVVVTRGKPLQPERRVRTESRVRTMVNLDRRYRGSVFGKNRILTDAEKRYRSLVLLTSRRGHN